MVGVFSPTNWRVFLRISACLAVAAGAVVFDSRAVAADGSNPIKLEATVQTPGGGALRVEALDPHIVRIWLKPTGEFTRERSLALEAAPATRLPLTMIENAKSVVVTTGALAVQIDRSTLGFTVTEADGTQLLANARVTLTGSGAAWTLAHAIDGGEKLFGLGQDNQNNGRLDRRGVICELWAGQKINSGNVTAEYPIPLLLSNGRRGHAYGVFYDNVHRLRFDLAKTKPDEVRCDAEGGEIDLYVFAGPKLSDVIERYTSLTGRPSLPPLWALGY